MNGVTAGYVPGGFEVSAQAPMAQVQGNADEINFLRELAKRQAFYNRVQGRPMSRGLGRQAGAAPVVASSRGGHESQDAFTRQLQQIQLEKARQEMEMARAKPSDFGSMRADRFGNWGTFVDPANIPAALQGTIMGGQYGDILNWDSNNPMIAGPQQAIANKYRY